MLQVLPLVVFAGLLIVGALNDVATMKIPNWVSISLAAIFPLAGLAFGLPLAQIGLHLLFGVGILFACFLLFQAELMGGGDAKMIAAAAVWTGFASFGPFALWTVLTGGAIALVLLFVRRQVKQQPTRPAFVNRLLKPRGGVPYGVAILVGGLTVIGALPFTAAALTLP